MDDRLPEHPTAPDTPVLPRWLLVALALGLAVALVPLWRVDMLPILDLPQHLATVRILRDLHTQPWHLDAYYQLDLGRTQYLGWYFAAVALSQVMSIETAAKVLFSLYVIAWPLGFLAFLRAHRREPTFALLAIPFVWSSSFWLGYANYVSALPLVFFWLAAWQAQLRAETRRRWLLLCVLPVGVYFLHAQALLHGLLLVGLTALVDASGLRVRRTWRLLLHVVPALGLFAAWALTSALMSGDAAWRASRAGQNTALTGVRYLPLPERLRQLPWNVGDLCPDFADAKLLLAGLALAALLSVVGWSAAQRAEVSRRVGWLPECGLALSLALYFALPMQWKWVYSINSRTVPFVALLLIASLARFRVPRAGLMVAVPALALVAALASLHMERLAIFNLEAAPARRLLALAPIGGRGVGLIYTPRSLVATHSPFLHFAQYGVVDRGGMADFSFANFPQSPVSFVAPGPPQLPMRFEKHPERFTMAQHGYWYDWFLVRDYGPSVRTPFVADAGEQVELLGRDGEWAIYRRRPTP